MFQILIVIIYLSFISLGLPDALLGSSWPIMQKEMNVPLSYAGIISMIIALGTIISSLLSDKITKKIGTAKVTAISVLMTALALLGFSISDQFWMLILWAIPYGLGAGSVDAALNNYVAIHYSSKHMSWLHCMWGVGASIGPYIMGYSLINNSWQNGYLSIAIIQIALTFILFISIPLWKKQSSDDNRKDEKSLKLIEIIKIKGVKEIMIAFFCYCAIEQTAGLWASTYLVEKFEINEELAASYASLFYIGITVGRFINGFLTIKFSDKTMVKVGILIILIGVSSIIFSFDSLFACIGLIVIGLGCAPIYPCFIHLTPSLFGKDKSQSVIGVQMASAYIGTCLMPPLFGLLASNISINLYPLYLLILLLLMIIVYVKLLKTKKNFF